MLIDKLGCWFSVLSDGAPPGQSRGALFVDWDCFDGEADGAFGPKQFDLPRSSIQLLSLARHTDMAVVILAHLPRIGAGISNWGEFTARSLRFCGMLGREGARLDAVAACAFDAAGKGALMACAHPWMPPKPGMIMTTIETLGIAPERSVLVAASRPMAQAGKSARLGSVVLLDNAAATGAWLDGDDTYDRISDFADLTLGTGPVTSCASASKVGGHGAMPLASHNYPQASPTSLSDL